MINEQQQEQASLYALGVLGDHERQQFELARRADSELDALVRSFQRVAGTLALSVKSLSPPESLRANVLERIRLKGSLESAAAPPPKPGFQFHGAADAQGWKELPLRGAWVKLLTLERERGYAVLLGKLGPGVKYPPHTHSGPEDLYILTGDLHLGDRTLGPGDFHHSDGGTSHGINYSVQGCTLMAVLPADHELVQFALAET